MKHLIASILLGLTLFSYNALAQDKQGQKQQTIYTDSRQILFILRDGEVSYKIDKAALTKEIDTTWIDELNVLKKPSEIEKFGTEGKDGVVIITFKDDIEAADLYLDKVKKQNNRMK